METTILHRLHSAFSIKGRFTLIRENRKLIAQFILTVFFIAVASWFLKHQQSEFGKIKQVLLASRWQFILLGILVTMIYIILQGFMYKLAFSVVKNKIPLASTILLFLKRNFISIFIPAGGITSLAFFTADIEKKGISKTKIHFATSIYAFVGILSVVSVAIPIFIYALIDGITGAGEFFGLAAMILVIAALSFSFHSLAKKGHLYRLIIRFSPSMEVFLDDIISHTIDSRGLIYSILVSILIDIMGIIHVYIAMLALNINPSLLYAMMGYLTAVISVFISPFMRGLGAVEVSMVFILTRFGYTGVESVAITFLNRFFEFWLPLFAGAFSFLLKINQLLMRVIPALLIFILGIINIISVITPAIHQRVQRLQDFIPVDAIAASNYFDEDIDAFLAYRISGNYAVVLENPVAETPKKIKQCIVLFEKYCYENSLKTIYYRVPEESLQLYKQLSKKCLFMGQEGVVDLQSFTLEGGKNKPLRNVVNKVIERGYKSTIHIPPIKDGVMQKLKAVSDEWLASSDRTEIVFSQGMFDWAELKQQTIITVENAEEKVIAFLNIIPDYAPGEGTYDLIRKTNDAPNGILDFILIELFRYLKLQNFSTVNIGFAPLSGLNDPHTFTEKSMKFAYEKIKSFSQYKGLRNFKEKYLPEWHNKYLVYSNDYDLLQVPAILTKVIRPDND